MFQLVFNTEKIVAWCSKLFTLLPGDLILTGTPPGVGVFMKPPEFLKASSRGEEKSRVSLNVEIFFSPILSKLVQKHYECCRFRKGTWWSVPSTESVPLRTPWFEKKDSITI